MDTVPNLSVSITPAKLALLKVHNEIMHRQLSQSNLQQETLPRRLSNAQYFIHELYFYLGFEPIEIAQKTHIKFSTILDLLSESIRHVEDDEFTTLTCFYYAAAQERISPQSSKLCQEQLSHKINTQSDEEPNIEYQALVNLIKNSAEPGFRQLMFKLHIYQQDTLCSQQNSSNDSV